MSSDDVRKDKRTPVIIKFRFRSATIDEFIEQYSRDISRGGIFVKHKDPLPVRTLVKFEFKLKTDQPVIRGVGRVVWTRDMTRATRDLPCTDFPVEDGSPETPGVILELDYWALMVR